MKKVFPQIKKFWAQGFKAEEWYHKNRDWCEKFYNKNHKIPKGNLAAFKAAKKKFWDTFKKKFPLVTEMLELTITYGHVDGVWKNKTPVMTTDPRNSLSGHINFGHEKDIDRLGTDDDVLSFSNEVWHFANWDSLATFLEKKFGAIKVNWISEEDTSIFDSIEV